MTKDELIAKQQIELEELRIEVADFKSRIYEANLVMICVGGPLNDNRLKYTKEQIADFFRIQRKLGL